MSRDFEKLVKILIFGQNKRNFTGYIINRLMKNLYENPTTPMAYEAAKPYDFSNKPEIRPVDGKRVLPKGTVLIQKNFPKYSWGSQPVSVITK